MSILDDVSNWFNPTPDQIAATDPSYYENMPQPDSSQPAPAAPAFAPSTMVSANYSLGDFCTTSQSLSQPNLPSTQEQMDNIGILADVVEQIQNQIGGVHILSGFRTKELQNALAAAGDPVASGTSFHELGRAVDIACTTMTPIEFFGRLLANSDLKSKFAEIAIKPSQNAIHLAVNVPSDSRDPKVLGLNSDNVYARLTADDILNYIKPYMPSDQATTDYADQLAAGPSNMMLYVVIAAGLGLLAMVATKRRTT